MKGESKENRLRRMIAMAFVAAIASPLAAQEGAGEPSVAACDDFKAEAARVLAQKPETLRVNALLFDAARKGCVGTLGGLLEAGASLSARDRLGNVALGIAAKAGRLAFARALLSQRGEGAAAQRDHANVVGSTALILAAQANRTDVAMLLLEAGANAALANAQGETALIAAAFNANAALARVLLDRKAPPDAGDATGKSAIVYAAARGSAAIVAMLLDAGVDPNARDGAQLTPLMWAAGHPDNAPDAEALATVKLLLARGAKIDLADDRGRTALMVAAGRGHGAIARVLLEAGADAGLRDKAGKSAADLAAGDEVKAALAGR